MRLVAGILVGFVALYETAAWAFGFLRRLS